MPKTEIKTQLTRTGDAYASAPRKILSKPKDWANRRPSEGRARTQRARKIKLKHEFINVKVLEVIFFEGKVGLPDARWTAHCENPKRKITARDALLMLKHCYDLGPTASVEVKWNENDRVITFEDLTEIIDVYSNLPIDDNPNI